jgi:hypothetical protein
MAGDEDAGVVRATRRPCDECGQRRLTLPVEAGPGVMAYFCGQCLDAWYAALEIDQAYEDAMRERSAGDAG